MSYVMIEGQVFNVDTLDQIEAAQVAMREAEIDELPVWVGEPGSPDTYKTNRKLFA